MSGKKVTGRGAAIRRWRVLTRSEGVETRLAGLETPLGVSFRRQRRVFFQVRREKKLPRTLFLDGRREFQHPSVSFSGDTCRCFLTGRTSKSILVRVQQQVDGHFLSGRDGLQHL